MCPETDAAEKKSSEAVKMMNLNYPIEKVAVWSKTPPQKAVTPLTAGEELGGTKTEPWFKPKPASVFPAKKRLVKMMMFDFIVQCFQVFHRSPPSSATNFQPDDDEDGGGGGGGGCCCFGSALSLNTVELKKKKKKKKKKIYPCTTYHG